MISSHQGNRSSAPISRGYSASARKSRNSHFLISSIHLPNLQICSSQWTQEQQTVIIETAKELLPHIKTIEIPPGLNAEKGGEAVLEYLEKQELWTSRKWLKA